jgi:sterol desaturase/sphingolipid hydroxylase (fatty acid hydroxylase superfamily)
MTWTLDLGRVLTSFADAFAAAQQAVFEAAAPWLFRWGAGNLLEDAYAATGWLLVGLLQIAVLLLLIGPLQRWRPVEPVTDRASVRTDVIYTLIHRLGLFRVLLFLSLEPVFSNLLGMLRTAGLATFHLDQLWPGVTDGALASFVIYLLVFDLLAYALHRAQHRFDWWWQLHALHHAQRQMTMWSDNRNHFLDVLLLDLVVVVVAQVIGVGPEQFMVLVALMQLSESLQHANVRLGFGRWGERLWISPRFHRKHHSLHSGDHNFGVLLPWWDMLFGTARFDAPDAPYAPTGVQDQLDGQRDYGRGLWSQQWLGLKRLAGKA